MAILSLAKPIENVQSSDEARVLALVDHLMPMLENWRKGEDLRNDISELDVVLAEEPKKAEEAKMELADVGAQRDAVFSNFRSYGKFAYIAIVIGLIGIFVVGVVVGLILIAIGIFLGFVSAKKERNRLQESMAKVEVTIAEITTTIEQTAVKKATTQKEVERRAIGFPEIKIGNVRFGMKMAQIAGRNLLLDASGSHVETVLKAVDVSALQEGLSHISDHVEALLNVPPLLSPSQQAATQDPVHELFGEESDLQELVGEFTVSLGKLKDVHLSLPLVSPKSILVNRLIAGEINQADEAPAIAMIKGNVSNAEIQSFVEEVNQTKENGGKVFAEVNQVFQNLENACALYSNARATSVNKIHQSLTEVLNRADWCNRRFYCPRTILSPRYIQDLLEVDPSKAYLLSFDDLIVRLHSDGEVGKRLSIKPELEQQLSEAYYTVQDFMGGVSFDQEGNRLTEASRPKHMEDQFRESVKRFTNVLQQVMTGSSYPILNFSAEAQLYFDPDTDEWCSDVVPFRYSTPNILKYGGVVKAYSDLMIPLWEHLWTEKADFRKSELFRTNESMIRMSEKESEKLIEVANQFRSDMRTVRENVHLVEADLKSKYAEIISFRDGMDKLGLLSDRTKAGITDEKLRDMVMGESMLSTSERYEVSLNVMPQSQAETRGTVHDPIDLIKEPNALVGYQSNSGARLLSA
ncbi:MAG: hypothetical protein NT042_07840 [Sulfuritalea sp.]|nr:hypothetical protein [Sulfuritalea sp.]